MCYNQDMKIALLGYGKEGQAAEKYFKDKFNARADIFQDFTREEIEKQDFSDYDLVQYNGMDLMVSALPDQYGVDLSIEYDSGETIKAYNNQENFLSFEAMRALKELFRSEITE